MQACVCYSEHVPSPSGSLSNQEKWPKVEAPLFPDGDMILLELSFLHLMKLLFNNIVSYYKLDRTEALLL